VASWTVEGPYGADWLHGVVCGGGFVRVAPSLRRSTSHTPRLRGYEAGAAWGCDSRSGPADSPNPASRLGDFRGDLLILAVSAVRDAVEGLRLARLQVSGVAFHVANDLT
jgi:hypothetical protein